MKAYNIHQAKTHLSRLVERAASGEEIVIARAGKPLAKLVPIAATAGPRTLGVLAGSLFAERRYSRRLHLRRVSVDGTASYDI